MTRQALVVGINRYPFLKEAPTSEPLELTTSVRDAEAIARLLELYGEFEVTRLPTGQDDWQFEPMGRLKREELKAAIARLFRPEESTPHTALLFFAGIGLRQEYHNGETEGFLATSDSNAPRGENWGVSLKWLRQVLQDSSVQQQIVWLDCSFSGELLNFTENHTGNPERDRCFIVASQADEYAYVNFDGRGFLTKALLQALNPKLSSKGTVTSETVEDIIPPQFEFEREGKTDYQHPLVQNSGDPIPLTGISGVPQWLTFKKHRLESLWSDTSGWFHPEGDEHSLPLVRVHDAGTVSEYFGETSKNINKANEYKKDVQEALGVIFPETWWQDKDSVKNLHESLKCLCGAVFCGQTDESYLKRPISVGAAYLIALMAHQKHFENVAPLTKEITTWAERPQSTYKLFPCQPPDFARKSAMALYDFFDKLFEDRDCQRKSQVIGTVLKKPGNRLEIQFSWNASDEADNRSHGESLASVLIQSIRSPKFSISELAENTKSSIIRLGIYMLANENGFMSPGVIYMEGNLLVITSVK
ncbi:MAG TPA: hypothetical protein DDW76_09440 [Cyanobacteria bacterium UBA11369]|nr:hypothetical protein [Cyanobacteria bacterium UBA11371]HBE17654.1 hypothetical protein [Cyanobacteria bacterium UBA11367]HBE35611.1 hypothetical protein [Cyanobacteria bacterium UBA11368]HBE49003.1 hypothetical protein [Cyanobacteria bacterium UBA11369]